MAVTTAEVMWIQALIRELRCISAKLPSIWCDNLSVTFLTANSMFHAHAKHIKLNYHFVKEKMTTKEFIVHFTCYDDQTAIIFTKNLIKSRFSVVTKQAHCISITTEFDGTYRISYNGDDQ
jgi:hypothetical protein